MACEILTMLGSFTTPVELGTNIRSMLLLFPLAAAIAIVYKATKLQKVDVKGLLRQSATLFCSIIVFITITAIVLLVIQRLFT